MVLALFFFLITGLRFSEAKELEPVKLRISNWSQAVRMIQANPFWGQGLGNYESNISYFTYPGEARSIYAHNFFLQFTAESGLFIPFFILLLLFLSWKKLKSIDYKREEKVLYISAFSILIFYNLFDIGFYFFPAGLAGAICLAAIYPGKSKKIGLNIVVLVLLSVFLTAENLSDTFQKRGEFRLNQKDYIEAESNYKKSLIINPFNLRSLMGYSRIHYDQNNYSVSEYYIDKVLTIYPDSSFANALKANIAYKKRRYFSSFYHAGTANKKNRLNRGHKRQYESIKNSLQAELTKSEN
jgi:tetratricopeptide (TPR) repeat protein